jgi:hypothetical protein
MSAQFHPEKSHKFGMELSITLWRKFDVVDSRNALSAIEG